MRTLSRSTFHILAVCASVILLCGATVTVMNSIKTPVAHADAPTNIVGYAWSENIGWISFNCLNQGVCASSNYGVTEDAEGNLSGYAWSNIGWISFTPTDVSGCPGGGGNCAPKFTSGTISGWAQMCSAFKNKDECDGVPGGYEDGSGGWKGWIHLAGNATDGDNTPYGITQNNDCTWSGWAWGEDPIGWIHFATTTGYSVRNTAADCNQVVASIQASSTALSEPGSTNLTWNSQNAISCTGSNFSTGAGEATEGQTSANVSANTIYGVVCTGPSGTASANVLITVNQPYSALSLTALPASVQKGKSTVIYWSAVNVTSCNVAGTNGFSASGTVGSQLSGAINTPTMFTLTCQSDNGPIFTETTVGIIPTIEEI